MIGILRFIGVVNAAVWLGAGIFFTFSAGPAIFSGEMEKVLGEAAFPAFSGRIAMVIVERYFVFNQVCALIALLHLVVEWLYMGRPLRAWLLSLLIAIFLLGLCGRYVIQPKLAGLHRIKYGPGIAAVEREAAGKSFRVWHGTSQALNLVMLAGVLVYLLRVTALTDSSRFRH